MAEDIKVIAERVRALTFKFEDTDDATEGLQEAENGEDLLIAMGMADAFLQGAITLTEDGETRLRDAVALLTEFLNEFSDEEDEDEDEEDEDEEED